jgi:hypothetical protein
LPEYRSDRYGHIELRAKLHHGNGIWQNQGVCTELWASTPRPVMQRRRVKV